MTGKAHALRALCPVCLVDPARGASARLE
jgi:hypothetical protein